MITGGGGNGAKAVASRDVNGSITSVQIATEFDLVNFRFISNPGRGYFNTSRSNTPRPVISYDPDTHPDFNDANVSVLLGGSIASIELCPCKEDGHTHMDPFIEIWDRNRSETDIDGQEGARARAVAKVRNGVIEKVVVLEGGRGYVDPVVYVRGSPNNRMFQMYAQIILEYEWGTPRQWRCTNLRESNDGSRMWAYSNGLYPPETVGDPVNHAVESLATIIRII